MIELRERILTAAQEHFKAHIEKHRMNVEIMLEQPRGIPEHSDFMDAIEKEMEEIARYDDLLEVLQRYFDY